MPPTYANHLVISTTVRDFLIECQLFLPDGTGAAVLASAGPRVILSPPLAKLFLHTLTESVAEYEQMFGTIPTLPLDETVAAVTQQEGETDEPEMADIQRCD